MRVLIVAGDAFAGLMGREQRFALGLAERGHDVVYVDPPLSAGQIDAADLREVAPRLRIVGTARRASPAPDRTDTTLGAWEVWGSAVQDVVRALTQGTKLAPEPFVPDVVLVYHPALLEPLRAVTRRALVFDCLDDSPSLAPSRPIADAFVAALEKGLPLADGMLAVNRYLLESWGRLLTEQAASAVLEHGVDTALFRPPDAERRAAARSALDLAPDRRLIGYLGRVDERLSYEDLMTLLALDERVVLLFVGEVSPEGHDIFRRLDPGRVMPLGPVRPDRAADLMAAADVLMFPFRREPHLEFARGLKLYEYLAMGLPVLATFRRSLKVFREVIYLYTTQEELEEGYRTALAEPAQAPVRTRRSELARAADWHNRIGELVTFLEPLAKRRGA
jgi:glycosyltransferase involved in cell wall biosynthesis